MIQECPLSAGMWRPLNAVLVECSNVRRELFWEIWETAVPEMGWKRVVENARPAMDGASRVGPPAKMFCRLPLCR